MYNSPITPLCLKDPTEKIPTQSGSLFLGRPGRWEFPSQLQQDPQDGLRGQRKERQRPL